MNEEPLLIHIVIGDDKEQRETKHWQEVRSLYTIYLRDLSG